MDGNLRRDAANRTPEACAPISTASFQLKAGSITDQIASPDQQWLGIANFRRAFRVRFHPALPMSRIVSV